MLSTLRAKTSAARRVIARSVSIHKIDAIYLVLLGVMCFSNAMAQNEIADRVVKLLDMIVAAGIGLVGLGLCWIAFQFVHGSGQAREGLTSCGLGAALIFGAKTIATALK